MSFSDRDIEAVWARAQYVNAENEALGYRKDRCGAWIQRGAYGNRDSKYGWEIHHTKAEARGGSDRFSNLVPFHWRNNAVTGEGNLVCAVQAAGTVNVG